VFLVELHELVIQQHLNLTAPADVLVDNHTFRSCLDLVGATLYIPFIAWEASSLDLKEIDMTTCGDIGTTRKLIFSQSDRSVIGTSMIIYKKKLTAHDLGLD